MSKYIWYSGATDITGKLLEDALGLTGTKTRPRNLRANDIVLCWGTKTNENVNLTGTILNHPDKIRANRDKLKSLTTMSSDSDLVDNIAKFCAANRVVRELSAESMVLPLVGRTKFHQGGKGFWLCLTRQHIDKAIADGAQYFQSYIDIKDEYRLHVVFGEVIYAVKKIENPTEEGWVAQRKEKVLDYARKNNVNIEEATLDYVLRRLVKEATLPDRIVRSNRRGWKFSSVRLSNISTALKNAAIKSVEVSGLDFGAVDCATSSDGGPYIIEINSGPGLQGTALQKYIDDFAAKIHEIEHPSPSRTSRACNAARNAVGRVTGAVGANNATPADESGTIDDEALVHMMNAVRSPEEGRRVLDIMNRGR